MTKPLKGDVTRDDSQRCFLAQHSITTLFWHCFEWLQHCSNIGTRCCAQNRRCESSHVTSPLSSSHQSYSEVTTSWIQVKQQCQDASLRRRTNARISNIFHCCKETVRKIILLLFFSNFKISSANRTLARKAWRQGIDPGIHEQFHKLIPIMDTTLPSQPFSSPIYLNAFSISKSHAVWKRGEAENLLAGYLDLGRGYVISME